MVGVIPAWFFWSFFVIFAPMGLFHWIWRYKRHNWELTVAEGTRASALVVERDEWTTPRRNPNPHGGSMDVHVRLTLEFRDQRGNVHRVLAKSVDNSAFMPKRGARTAVVYDP